MVLFWGRSSSVVEGEETAEVSNMVSMVLCWLEEWFAAKTSCFEVIVGSWELSSGDSSRFAQADFLAAREVRHPVGFRPRRSFWVHFVLGISCDACVFVFE